jgi:hypothetical protein
MPEWPPIAEEYRDDKILDFGLMTESWISNEGLLDH